MHRVIKVFTTKNHSATFGCQQIKTETETMMETIIEEEIGRTPTQGKGDREEEVIAKLTGALLLTSLSNNNNNNDNDNDNNNNKENDAKITYEAFLNMYR